MMQAQQGVPSFPARTRIGDDPSAPVEKAERWKSALLTPRRPPLPEPLADCRADWPSGVLRQWVAVQACYRRLEGDCDRLARELELSRAREPKVSLMRELRELRTTNKELAAENRTLATENVSMRSELETSQSLNSRLEEQLAAATRDLRQGNVGLKMLRSALARAHAYASGMRTECARARA